MSDASLKQNCQDFAAVWSMDEWTEVTSKPSEPHYELRYHLTQTQCWLQVGVEIDVSFDWYKLAKCPEFACRHPELQDTLLEFDLLEIFAPGDALMSMRLLKTQHENTMLTICGRGTGWQKVRVAHHNDFPVEGMYTVVTLPVGDTSMDMGIVLNACFMYMAPGKSEGSTMVRYTMRCPWNEYPEWFTPISANFVGIMHEKAACFKQEQSRLQPVAESFYTVLTLRGCSRGLPLLPQDNCTESSTQAQVGDFFWKPADEGFSLASYLHNFLRRTGCDTKIYHTMYGEHLMPYQAAVLTEDWERVQDSFRDAFRSQCSAYRLLRGGSGAPKIRTDVGARFSQDSTASSDDKEDVVIVAEERNTFLQLREKDAFTLRRKAAEYP